MKREVYSWRREARRRTVSMSAALDTAAREWLQKSATESDAEEVQRRLHKAASKWLGSLASGNERRSQGASRAVRDRLRRHYGR